MGLPKALEAYANELEDAMTDDPKRAEALTTAELDAVREQARLNNLDWPALELLATLDEACAQLAAVTAERGEAKRGWVCGSCGEIWVDANSVSLASQLAAAQERERAMREVLQDVLDTPFYDELTHDQIHEDIRKALAAADAPAAKQCDCHDPPIAESAWHDDRCATRQKQAAPIGPGGSWGPWEKK